MSIDQSDSDETSVSFSTTRPFEEQLSQLIRLYLESGTSPRTISNHLSFQLERVSAKTHAASVDTNEDHLQPDGLSVRNADHGTLNQLNDEVDNGPDWSRL